MLGGGDLMDGPLECIVTGFVEEAAHFHLMLRLNDFFIHYKSAPDFKRTVIEGPASGMATAAPI